MISRLNPDDPNYIYNEADVACLRSEWNSWALCEPIAGTADLWRWGWRITKTEIHWHEQGEKMYCVGRCQSFKKGEIEI